MKHTAKNRIRCGHSSRWGLMGLAATAALSIAASLPAFGYVENLTNSSVGAQATFSSRKVIDGSGVIMIADFSFSVPNDPQAAPSVGVTITEFDEQTGAVLFAGNAFSEVLEYRFGEGFDWCHLSAALEVPSQMGDSVRDVRLNVVWNVAGEAANAAIVGDGTGLKDLKKEQFAGLLIPMDAVGEVRVSNPALPGYEFTATKTDSPAVMWDTSTSANLLTPGPAPSDVVSNATSDLISAATTSDAGSWGGYWTWRWDGTKWIATWTWVWYSNGTGYSVS